MGFIKFVFVLVIVIPLAVLMMYFINNLNEKLKTSSKAVSYTHLRLPGAGRLRGLLSFGEGMNLSPSKRRP